MENDKKNEILLLLKKKMVIDTSTEGLKFQKKRTYLYYPKFWIYIFAKILGIKHYSIMNFIGYESFLFSKDFITTYIIPKKRPLFLLDIGAGSGSITKKFEPYVSKIFFQETSVGFQKKLKSMGYTHFKKGTTEKVDIMLILNVLDRAKDPKKLLTENIGYLKKNGRIIISAPFPFRRFSQDREFMSEKNTKNLDDSLINFYQEYIVENGLTLRHSAQLPYRLISGDRYAPTVFNNYVFICTQN